MPNKEINFPALEEKRKELRRIFDAAGPGCERIGSVEIKDASGQPLKTIAEKAQRVRELNDELEQLKAIEGIATGGGSGSFEGGSGGNAGGSGLKSIAMRQIDQHVKSGILGDYAAERVENLMRQGSAEEQTVSQKWAASTGSPEYLSAFMKRLMDPTTGHMLWTAKEADAYRRVHEVKAAMAITATHGLEMVPLVLDPAINLTSAGNINPLRQISRVVQTSADKWRGVTSAGATAEWKAEAAEAADGSPLTANVDIPVHMADCDVIYSYEVGMDALDFVFQVRTAANDAVDNLLATAYTTGTGSGQPTGIITALAGTASEINTTGTEAVVASDAFALQNALPARFSANAQWCANVSIINTFRQFETTNGALKFPELAQNPPFLLTKRMNEVSNMDGAINAAATANNYVLLYGDFSKFVIVDRIGSTVEIIPDVGANRRPTGQRHFFLTLRTGSDVVVDNAFRMLDVPTTA